MLSILPGRQSGGLCALRSPSTGVAKLIRATCFIRTQRGKFPSKLSVPRSIDLRAQDQAAGAFRSHHRREFAVDSFPPVSRPMRGLAVRRRAKPGRGGVSESRNLTGANRSRVPQNWARSLHDLRAENRHTDQREGQESSQDRQRDSGCIPGAAMAHRDAAGGNGSNRIFFHGAPHSRMMPNGCLGSPGFVLLCSVRVAGQNANRWGKGQILARSKCSRPTEIIRVLRQTSAKN
jgi:hypothetical protein